MSQIPQTPGCRRVWPSPENEAYHCGRPPTANSTGQEGHTSTHFLGFATHGLWRAGRRRWKSPGFPLIRLEATHDFHPHLPQALSSSLLPQPQVLASLLRSVLPSPLSVTCPSTPHGPNSNSSCRFSSLPCPAPAQPQEEL